MHFPQGIHDGSNNVESWAEGDLSSMILEILLERHARDIGHHDVGCAVAFEEIEQQHDSGMIVEASHGPTFFHKLLQAIPVSVLQPVRYRLYRVFFPPPTAAFPP